MTISFINRIFYCIIVTIIFSLCVLVSSYGNGNGICEGKDETISCLIENYEELYSTNYSLFWNILHKAADKAQSCKSYLDVTRFMELVRVERRGAEFEEFFHEKIEKLCIKNTRCFFEGLSNLTLEEQTKIIDVLKNPIFEEQSAIRETFIKKKDKEKYKKITEIYLKQ
jgi:hypothetical protein